MSSDLIGKLIDKACGTILEHADELTELDQAIGDGDHGLNMKRGFEAIAADRATLEAQELWPAVQKAGMTLVMKVGGASGPLYGSLFMSMGKAEGDCRSTVSCGRRSCQERAESQMSVQRRCWTCWSRP